MSQQIAIDFDAHTLVPRTRKWGKRTVFVVKPGDVYNKLTVLEKITGGKWLCLCECGNKKAYKAAHIVTGHAKACGCEKGQGFPKHGHSRNNLKSRTYQSWQHMLRRCLNPDEEGFRLYRGRGIKVCDRWLSFDNFLADMGERPTGRTLDRYPNNNGNYEPGNCRWATPAEQAQNTRRTKLTAEQAREIKTLEGTGISSVVLGKKYGVTYRAVLDIWRGKAWRDA